MNNDQMKNIFKQLAGRHVLQLVRGIRRIYRAKYIRTGYCNVCGHQAVFYGRNAFTLTQKKERNDLACSHCGAKARNRALVRVVLEILCSTTKSLRHLLKKPEFRELNIYNASSSGALHSFLAGFPNYVCSEYFPNIPIGSIHNGIRCEDLESLTFQDCTFDLVISEDVMEHVRHPDIALREVFRVLKQGDFYVFTVPIYGDETVVRVDTTTNADVHLLPPLYHGDPLRKEGALAYNDFGRDVVDLCEKSGFEARLVEFEAKGRNWLCGSVIVAKKI